MPVYRSSWLFCKRGSFNVCFRFAEDPRKMGGWDPVIKVYTLAGHHKEPNNERQLYSSDYHPTKLYYSKPGNIRVMR